MANKAEVVEVLGFLVANKLDALVYLTPFVSHGITTREKIESLTSETIQKIIPKEHQRRLLSVLRKRKRNQTETPTNRNGKRKSTENEPEKEWALACAAPILPSDDTLNSKMSDVNIIINRSPVMTLWAVAVAQRLGYKYDDSLSLASSLVGMNARAKGAKLGFTPSQSYEAKMKARKNTTSSWQPIQVSLLGRTFVAFRKTKNIPHSSCTNQQDAHTAEHQQGQATGHQQARTTAQQGQATGHQQAHTTDQEAQATGQLDNATIQHLDAQATDQQDEQAAASASSSTDIADDEPIRGSQRPEAMLDEASGNLISPKSVRSSLVRSFGNEDTLRFVYDKMTKLAQSISISDFRNHENNLAFTLYCDFRPDVVHGRKGWGQKCPLKVDVLDSLIAKQGAFGGPVASSQPHPEVGCAQSIEELLQTHSDGLTARELAEQLTVPLPSVENAIQELQEAGAVYCDANGKCKIL